MEWKNLTDWSQMWLLSWMLVWAGSDIRHRAVRLEPVVLVLICGLVWQAVNGRLFVWDTAGGILMGAAAWAFSCLTEGRLGKGDALVILCLGLYMGLAVSLAVLMLSLVLSSAAALYLLAIRKKPAGTAIPFIPFLTGGFIIFLAAEVNAI